MTTYTGRRVWPAAVQPEDVCIEDIAHALSQQCRFAGHTRVFYSTAQHSVLVARSCEPRDALWGLLHDASEAYLSDIVRPLKHSPWLDGYRELEAGTQRAICRAFGLPLEQPASVTAADRTVCAVELRDLVNLPTDYTLRAPGPDVVARIEPASSSLAELLFLAAFDELGGLR